MTEFYRLLVLMTGTLAVFTWASTAGAASTDVVLNLEGNPTCSSLGPNSEILDIKLSGPGNGGTGSGPDPDGMSPFDPQLVSYSIDENNVLSWEVDAGEPVNYVILKGKGGNGGGTVYHYGVSPGAMGDNTGLVLFPVDPAQPEEGPKINALSFCYGLSDGTTPPEPEPEPELPVVFVGDCENPDPPFADLNLTEIANCPTDEISSDPNDPELRSDERILVSFSPNDANFNMVMCTCNLSGVDDNGFSESEFEQCDPNAAQDEDEDPQAGGACSNGKGFVKRMPISIIGVEDPNSFLCFAVTGDRSCFFHFAK